MLNTIYRLTAPRKFEIAFSDISFTQNVIVRPTYLSICNADQRYFQGLRDAAVLAKKLPMALIHEGIGKVVYDPSGHFQKGQRVIMIPNTPAESDPIVAENYLLSSKFRASGFDGFMQEYVDLPEDRLVPVPENVSNEVAAFSELVSVSGHAISRFERFSHTRRNSIGVWGDGNLAYITALLLSRFMKNTKIYVFGVSRRKLADFTFVSKTFLINEIPENLLIDHAFECVGGQGSPKAINQIIDHINPEGTISILGVSEYPVEINTRMILEKGLRLFGSSRSGRSDFLRIADLYSKDSLVVEHMSRIVGSIVEVASISDMQKAFEIDIHKEFGKTVMKWF